MNAQQCAADPAGALAVNGLQTAALLAAAAQAGARRFLSPENYCLLTVPPLVWNGFKAIGDKSSIVANCVTLPHDPQEIERKPAFDKSIPYEWKIQHR